MGMRWSWILAGAMIVIGLLPIIGLSVVSVLASVGGCRVNEGMVQPCMIAGLDWGGLLHGLTVAGWLFFLTAPIALAGFVLAIALAVAALIRRGRS